MFTHHPTGHLSTCNMYIIIFFPFFSVITQRSHSMNIQLKHSSSSSNINRRGECLTADAKNHRPSLHRIPWCQQIHILVKVCYCNAWKQYRLLMMDFNPVTTFWHSVHFRISSASILAAGWYSLTGFTI